MSITDNTEIFGRKVFFVCATFSLNSNVILRLMEQEYEIYKVDEYRQLKSLLQLNPDAIVYINADSQNTANVWFNFISYFETDPQYSKCSFGVFAGKLKPAERERWVKALKLEAGFYDLEKSFGEIMGNVMMKLTDLKAKGMRQFVRMSCAENKESEAYFVNANTMYKMKLLDISSIGAGINIPAKYGQLAQPKSVLHGLTLVLGSKQLKVNARIHAIKPTNEGIITILIFTPETPDDIRNYIRKYICDELQKRMMNTILSLPWDKTDYSVKIEVDDGAPPSEEQKSEEPATDEK